MRKTESFTVTKGGSSSANRDYGKTFVLTEMPAIQGEQWATQALVLLASNGVQVSPGEASTGMSGLATVLGSKAADNLALLRALQHPSLEGWWDCVRYQHDPKHKPQPINQGEACQIEEISTVIDLRMKVLELHTNFFTDDGQLTSDLPSSVVATGSSPTRMSRGRPAQ